MKAFTLAALMSLAALTATAQSPTERVRAAEVLRTSLRMLGSDDDARFAAFEVTLEARASRASWVQARSWYDPVLPASPTRLRYLVDARNERAVFELRSPSPGGIWFHNLTSYDASGAAQVDLLKWRTGTDINRGTAAAARSAIAGLEQLVPHGLVRQALRSDSTLSYEGELRRAGTVAHLLSYTESASQQRISIEVDAGTMLPTASTVGPNRFEFSDYRQVDGVRVAHKRTQITSGLQTNVLTVVGMDVTPRLEAGRFALPPGYVDAPAAGAPRAVRIGEGVYRLDGMPGGYHAAFVVGEEGVQVIEAPLNAQFSAAALQVIAETAPGKPVTHVMITHHHSDHVGGLGPYVARGARVVVHRGLGEAIRQQLPDSLRGVAQIIPAVAGWRLGNGTSRIVALPVPNEHADGNIAWWMPGSGVLVQGDLLYVPERGPVPAAFPVTAALQRALDDARISPRLIVGIHGRTATPSDLAESLLKAREDGFLVP
ncbi:MAG: MBL fold metallo-hydrolase [Gemmatimonadaceae bacterium]|nr:MBL fold metallo-hydrolase [Gemmatimonadaceae bacterium]